MPTATALGKTFTFPEGTTTDQMGEAIDEYFAGRSQPTREQLESALRNAHNAGDVDAAKKLANAIKYGLSDDPTPQDTENVPTGVLDRMNSAIQSNPVGRVVSEGAAAFNRGVTNIADFFTVDQINNIAQLAGQGRPVPTITESLSSGTQGGFMEPGLGRDVVRSAGEVVPSAVGVGGAMRGAAQNLSPVLSGTESLGRGVVRQMGSTRAGQDVVAGAAAGAGAEVGGEIGKALGGETGEQVGQFAGAIVAPLSSAALGSRVSAIRSNAEFKKLLGEAAPTSQNLKDAAHRLYQQIDDMGIRIPQPALKSLSGDVVKKVRGEGFNARIHPKSAAALDELVKASDEPMSPGELDIIRRVANQAAASIDNPSDARLGRIIVGQIDDFMSNALPRVTGMRDGDEVATLHNQARALWGRARKTDIIDEAVNRAMNQASGFENGMRVQFRSILNSKRRRTQFNGEEIQAMQRVVRGGKAENIAKALGKFGFTEGQASSMLMGSLGVAGGAAVGGPAGAAAVPMAGAVFKSIAQNLTKRNVDLANRLVRTGANGRAVVATYMQSVPASQRNVEELTALLIHQNVGHIALRQLQQSETRLIADAAYFASVVNSQNNTKPPGNGDAD